MRGRAFEIRRSVFVTQNYLFNTFQNCMQRLLCEVNLELWVGHELFSAAVHLPMI